MALIRWEPFSEMSRFQRDMNRLFDTFFRSREGEDGGMLTPHNWAPAVDVYEDVERYLIKAELPGLEAQDVDVKLDNHVLTIRGEKKLENEDKKENYHRIERYYGSFSRSFTLPSTVETDKIAADFKNGVLQLSVPKRPEVQPKQIKVEIK